MTTIVFDGHYLAADTRYTLGLDLPTRQRGEALCPHCDQRIKHTHSVACKIFVPNKKVMFKGSRIIATAGAGYDSISRFITELLFTHPEPFSMLFQLPKQLEKNSTKVLVLTEQKAYTINNFGNVTEVKKLPFTMGSGAQAAELALKQGKNAMEAVIEASTVDESTNDQVDFIKMVPSNIYRIHKYQRVNKK